MNEKEITRLASIRTIEYMFDGITDDDHALFVMETLGEFPDDQVVSAIDVNGAKVNWVFSGYTMASFTDSMQTRLDSTAEAIKLNLLVNY